MPELFSKLLTMVFYKISINLTLFAFNLND